MLDIKLLRDKPDVFKAGLERRGQSRMFETLQQLDSDWRQALLSAENGAARRNALSKEIGQLKSKGGDASVLMAEVAGLKDALQQSEVTAADLEEKLQTALSCLPNFLAVDVPEGADEDSNLEVRRWGEPQLVETESNPPVPDHAALGAAMQTTPLGNMRFDLAAQLSGSRFTVLLGGLARLERALMQYMLDLATTEFGYIEASVPLLVRDAALFGTGNLPKFAEDLFKTSTDHYLIPTAEVPLTNLVMDSITSEEVLPLRLTALTPCFRSEAGSAGRDTSGMLRQHQFWKVELVSITTPEQSAAEHDRLVGCAETVLKRLELPFRTMLLCSGDTGFGATKTYDLEVWLPGQQKYREISSCSNCGDFQARRMKARTRKVDEKQTRLVHTLNGSGLAVGRTFIAVMENYQQADGSIAIPSVLQPYMGGLTVIPKDLK